MACCYKTRRRSSENEPFLVIKERENTHHFGIGQLGLDLLNNGRDELLLFGIPNTSLVAHPGIKSSLDVRGEGSLLLELIYLRFHLSNFLGHAVQVLGHVHKLINLGNVSNTFLDNGLVVFTSLVKDFLDGLSLCHAMSLVI